MKEGFKLKFSTIILIGLVVALGILVYSIFLPDYQDVHKAKVLEERAQKDGFFISSDKSPIESKDSFSGLHYYEYDATYRVVARIVYLYDNDTITITRSDGQKHYYKKAAKAYFTLKGKDYELSLLKDLDDKSGVNMLFLPFADKTNGQETYNGGRYIDVSVTDPNNLLLDFNRAYNPYCAYNYRYSCPLPPSENYIEYEIKAGEKKYRTLE